MARTFIYPRPRPRGLLGRRLEAYEQAVALAGGALALLLGWLAPSWPVKLAGFLAPAALTGWVVFAPYQGRTRLRWWEIRRTYRRMLRRGELLYRSRAPGAGQDLSGTPRPVGSPAGMPETRWMRGRIADGDLAVLLLPGQRMFVATVEIEADADYGGLDEPDKEMLIGAFEHLLEATADSGGRVRRLAFGLRVIPSDPDAHARDVAARRAADAPRWLHESYDTLQRMVATQAEDRRLYLTMGVPYTPAIVAEARKHPSFAEGFGTVVSAEVDTVVRSLELARLRLVRPLDEAALASLIRSHFDPAHAIDDTVGMSAASAWPARLDGRHPRHVVTRSWSAPEPPHAWFTSTAWFRQLPVTPSRINFLAPLLLWMPPCARAVTILIDLAPAELALRRAMADLTNETGQAKTRGVEDPREASARGRAAQTLGELGDGAAGTVVTAYVSVTAPGADELGRLRDATRAAAAQSGVRLEWCDFEQQRALATALPLATGLIREDT